MYPNLIAEHTCTTKSCLRLRSNAMARSCAVTCDHVGGDVIVGDDVIVGGDVIVEGNVIVGDDGIVGWAQSLNLKDVKFETLLRCCCS